jgi:hypothetical protein
MDAPYPRPRSKAASSSIIAAFPSRVATPGLFPSIPNPNPNLNFNPNPNLHLHLNLHLKLNLNPNPNPNPTPVLLEGSYKPWTLKPAFFLSEACEKRATSFSSRPTDACTL